MFGPEHLLWGSDYPANKDIAGALNVVNELEISQEQKKKILGKNLEDMFGLRLIA
jgi:predicted TIM-barrel fold metal-dependent hydrolase